MVNMKKALILILGVVMILAGCASGPTAGLTTPLATSEIHLPTQEETPPPTATATAAGLAAQQPADIAGIWLINFPDYKPAYLLFRLDGTYTIAPNKTGSHGHSGTYSFANGILDIQDVVCGQDSLYSVTRQDQDGQPAVLIFTTIQNPCPTLTGFFTNPAPAWVGPLS
jgi:hypothetical protein